MPQTDADEISVVNTLIVRANQEIVYNFIATYFNATKYSGSNKVIGDIQTISGTMKCSVISARTIYFKFRCVDPIMGRQAAFKIKKCINGGISANEARVQVPNH